MRRATATLTTTNANDLIVASDYLQYPTTGPGSGYTSRMLTADADVVEDKFVTTAGSNSATAPIMSSGWWLMSAAAFRAASGPADTQAPTAPTNLTATVAGNTQINLSWTASTDNVGVTGYRVEQCQGCGLLDVCAGRHHVRQHHHLQRHWLDRRHVLQLPRARHRCRRQSQHVLQYRQRDNHESRIHKLRPRRRISLPPLLRPRRSIFRGRLRRTTSALRAIAWSSARAAGCSTFAQVGTTPGATTYSATGLTISTSYSYRVRATDAAGNLSAYSNTASASTLGDTQAPTAPSNLTATAASTTQINLSWTASTDNVGVTGYRVEQCQGSGCSTFAQVGTTAGTTTYSATGLTTNTSYSYRVRATDAAGNLSGYSNTASTTTLSDTQAPTAPTNLAATAVSGVQINLTWTASTDNVGVTGYRVEQCQGSGCSHLRASRNHFRDGHHV